MDYVIYLQALILGLIEGLTEFLPVSSTGHLIIIGDLIGFHGERAKVFEIFIQLGAILAVCWAYRQRLINVFLGLMRNDLAAWRFTINIAAGFLPAAVLGLIFYKTIKTYLFNPITVAVALIVGGIIILLIERRARRPRINTTEDIPLKSALLIGFAQACAMLPGVSRSGATIMGSMMLGLSRRTAAEFSFFLAIPTMLAATAYDLYKNRAILGGDDYGVFALGFFAAFFSAVLAVKVFVAYVSHASFKPFAYYRIAFGLFILISWQTGWIQWPSA